MLFVSPETANFEVLGIRTWLDFWDVYRDDGFVPSVDEHYRKLRLRYSYFIDETVVPEKIPEKIKGVYSYFYTPGILQSFCFHHIYYTDTGSEIDTVRMRAHEEAHVLLRLKRASLLARKILRDQGIKINFDDVVKHSDIYVDDMGNAYDTVEEVGADIGAIYALHQRGMLPAAIATPIATHGNFIKALEIYEKSRTTVFRI
jgi:hypothetical protein